MGERAGRHHTRHGTLWWPVLGPDSLAPQNSRSETSPPPEASSARRKGKEAADMRAEREIVRPTLSEIGSSRAFHQKHGWRTTYTFNHSTQEAGVEHL